MRNQHWFVFVSSVALMGCAATSTGVQKLGPDTYTVSSQVVLGPGKANAARAAALKEAEQFCATLNKELVVDGYSTSGSAMSVTGDSEVRFKCLARGDRDLQRPNMQLTPNMVIEDRRR